VNRIERPNFFDDNAALNALAVNELVASFPQLQAHVPAIIQGYQDYLARRGNALTVGHVPLPENIEKFLRGHYGSPPGDLSFLSEIRARSDVDCCPMCGALHSGTLDHILPQSGHAAFAIFGPNLVPACRCNSLRGNALTGPHLGQRILHPYFDDVLKQRLLSARFEDLGLVPKVSLHILLPLNHPSYPAVEFHTAHVVERNNVRGFLRKSWTKLLRKPSSISPELRMDPRSRAELIAILTRQLETNDEFHGSQNNWLSVFLMGLLHEPVVDWLTARFSSAGREADGPLLPDAI
jgi:hypothetical protein